MADRYWLVPVSGFDEQVVMAATRDKARWAVCKCAREAGYFSEGPAAFFAAVGRVSEIGLDEVHSRIGGHRPIGAPQDWQP